MPAVMYYIICDVIPMMCFLVGTTEGKGVFASEYAIAVNGDVKETEAIVMSHNEAYLQRTAAVPDVQPLIKPYITLIMGEEPPILEEEEETVDEGNVINCEEQQPVTGATTASIETADHSYEPDPDDYVMARPITGDDYVMARPITGDDEGTGSLGYVINSLSYEEPPPNMHLPQIGDNHELTQPLTGDGYVMERPITGDDCDDEGTGSSGYVINALNYEEPPPNMHLPAKQPITEHDYTPVY